MTAATKVTIAVAILFAAVLGIYYGFSGSRPGGLEPQSQAAAPDPHPQPEVAPVEKAPALPADPGGVLASDALRPAPGAAANPAPAAAPPAPKGEEVWVLRAPSLADPVAAATAAAPGSPGAGAPVFTEYWVREGDSLWTIAAAQLGDPLRWRQIVDANPGIDADRLQLGARLRLPTGANGTLNLNQGAAVEPPPPGAAPAGKFHVIQPGDSLSSIARRYYGDITRWHPIYDANRAAIGSDPDRLKVGTRLVIP